ncbi:scavenger receptor class F member 1-like isoform X3 [Biomphalaria glabrata]|uniref:Scavenger receptor class F member 1-like isoform X3 n=1 Tax=Biomphalaria glabrata TaxID=6526 RepID=A0A9W2ZCK2_BIOGL|nr:scavenger receptor class F member 1-like isoform X3 [Biomphalaria glabrata]
MELHISRKTKLNSSISILRLFVYLLPVSDGCLYQRYGEDCSKVCNRCIGNCDKVNGTCKNCVEGYTDPKAGCNKDCPLGTFGFRCKGDCALKCKEDCLERIYGTCPETASSSRFGTVQSDIKSTPTSTANDPSTTDMTSR